MKTVKNTFKPKRARIRASSRILDEFFMFVKHYSHYIHSEGVSVSEALPRAPRDASRMLVSTSPVTDADESSDGFD